jgi:hypothetical protein
VLADYERDIKDIQ